MLARKKGGTIILNVIQSTSNKGISFVPFTSASNNDFKIRRSVDDGTMDRREEGAHSVGERLKEGAAKAVETGLNVGEKVKESMDEAWDATKETTNNIKDGVVDDDANDEMKKGYEYPSTNNNKDKHTQNLRKRADGYDLRDTH